MNNITISVIMLTYNRESLVERAIQSVVAQNFKDFELIVVDNGSTDRSGAIADEYASKDTRVKVIHRVKGNIGSGRNAGLAIASGEYITFVDDDDECSPDYLNFLYNLTEQHNADISICGALRDENGEVTSIGIPDKVLIMNAEESIIALMWRKLYNTGFPTKLISNKVFKETRFAETGQYDDISLLYKILAEAEVVVYHGLPKYRVHRHDTNNSLVTTKEGLITPEYLSAYRKAYRERTEWLGNRFPDYADYWWYFDWSFQISMVSKIVSNNLTDCKEQLEGMRQELVKCYDEFMKCKYVLDFEKDWMDKYII